MDSIRRRQDGNFLNLEVSEARSLFTRLSDFLAGQGIEAYLVGGWVRDALLGRDTADIDIAIASDALAVASKMAEALSGKYVPLDTENRIARVVLAEGGAVRHLDFSTFEGSIERDLGRRDFTINAMAVNLSGFAQDAGVRIVDPFGGRSDLRQRIIRAVTETAFAADGVRLLRAARLAAELGFSIDGGTEALMRQSAGLITGVAGERIREELLRLLAVSGGALLAYLDRLSLLTAIFPEMAEAKGVAQPKEHYWDVFEHSLRMVGAVDFLLRQGVWEYADDSALAEVTWSAALEEHFAKEVSSGSTRRVLLKLAALLHDINKPQTKAIDAGGRTRFLGHAQDGAATAAAILERLRFSGKEIKLVETEIKHHLRPTQMSQAGLPTRRAIYRYFRDTAEAGIDILFLSLADHLASRGPQLIPASWQEHAGLVDYVLSQYFEKEKIVKPPKLVDGYDIINIFRMTPGPLVGELLETVREAQASGEVATREEALSLIERLIEKNA